MLCHAWAAGWATAIFSYFTATFSMLVQAELAPDCLPVLEIKPHSCSVDIHLVGFCTHKNPLAFAHTQNPQTCH